MVTRQNFQPPSTQFLLKLGYRFARALFNNDNMISENYLWRAVVINALEDCMILRSDRKSATLKTTAHNWILSYCRDFEQICNWAQLDPDEVVYAYRGAIKKKEVTFTQRQLLWFEYNKLSRKTRQEPDHRYKSSMKKEMTNIRLKVKVLQDVQNDYVSTLFLNALS